VIGLLQRVAWARVDIDGQPVGAIDRGLLAFVCAERGDNRTCALRLLERLLDFRLFPDAQGKMNLSVRDIGGGLLLVPQFTLAADTDRGNRPSFTPAAPPQEGRQLFDFMVAEAVGRHAATASGRFGAHMQVSLLNDGPVTFWLRVPPQAGAGV
jgi:D-tyrosyl-tRNA(Tyr) deacylase